MDHPAAQHILGLYQRHADAFVRLRSRALFEKSWLDAFLAAVGKTGHILDIGCGTGEPIAAYFMAQGYTLTGVDGSEAMLAYARAQFPTQRWCLQDMRALALEETFDGLVAWDSFFHLSQGDQRAMFAVFARHSHPGSALLFTSGPGDGIAMGEFEGEPLFHASLAPEEYRALLAENGFTVLAMRAEDPECTGHTVWLAKRE
ncbi:MULTISPECIES: class I SAM-dependent DNA methyltransferase [Enterobacteriaceae]|uniref:class I SAM-dependent DNA methyltransferase n=1 Tax=Enterobacteriaceae TaxID=543 RepID=UPI0015DC6E9E|nr:class I SAM-dependent methyltransferase [Klebsiella sp. WP8-S18-ESBL-06]BBT71666.1 methyltransferase [Klebsiella sp. WP8-S18-ESBL-06]